MSIVLALPGLGAAGAPRLEKARSAVTRAYPNVAWGGQFASGDFDCDGKVDYAFLGKRKGRVYVGFQLSRGWKIQVLHFGIGAGQEDSICEEPAEIAVEGADFDPSGAIGDVDGLVISDDCEGLQLIGGECDFFHIYFNHNTNALDWWRL